MADKFFEKFPVITYGNNEVTDITRNTVMRNSVLQNPYAFYKYDISSGEREDQFANRYYGDPYRSWIVYMANQILDPYYEWYMDENQFEEFIEMKYGTIQLANEKIKYYKNAWESVEDLDVNGYDALPAIRKKYWEPIRGNYNAIISYSRKQEEWSAKTNKTTAYKVDNSVFKKDELCTVKFDDNNKGRGQVCFSNSSVVMLNHLSGVTEGANVVLASALTSIESGANTRFTSANLVSYTINPTEYSYWRPISYYEYESNKNEYNKTIRVIDSDYSRQLSEELKTLLKE